MPAGYAAAVPTASSTKSLTFPSLSSTPLARPRSPSSRLRGKLPQMPMTDNAGRQNSPKSRQNSPKSRPSPVSPRPRPQNSSRPASPRSWSRSRDCGQVPSRTLCQIPFPFPTPFPSPLSQIPIQTPNSADSRSRDSTSDHVPFPQHKSSPHRQGSRGNSPRCPRSGDKSIGQGLSLSGS
jgi:hypothetical protein